MATFVGVGLTLMSTALSLGNASPGLAAFTTPWDTALGTGTDVLGELVGAPRGRQRGDVVQGRQYVTPGAATQPDLIGADRFERIIVLIADAAWGKNGVLDVGTLLSTRTLTFEVWNAYRASARVLSALTVGGTEGVTASTGTLTLPLTFNPLQSYVFSATMSISGAPSIENTISLDFTTDEDDVELSFSGRRLIPMTIPIDWADGFEASDAWLTDILTAYDGTEQRIQQRGLSRPRWTYTALAIEPQEADLLDMLMFGWLDQVFGVPFWPDATPLGVALSPGDSVLAVPTTDRAFAVGEVILIYRDAVTWEAATIDAMDASTITIRGTVAAAWAAKRTRVIPLKLGRLPASVTMSHRTSKADRVRLSFEGIPA